MKPTAALLLTLPALFAGSCASPTRGAGRDPGPGSGTAAGVEAVLDDFHLAAAQADAGRYFAHFAPGAVFYGTDASERWSVEELEAYATPFFSEGRGWTYVAVERAVFLDDDGDTAWFDERLENEKYGEVRGSGVLRWDGARWRVAQYNLAFPVPNELAADLVERVRALESPVSYP